MDLNHRPPGPEPGALARLRYAPTDTLGRIVPPKRDSQINIAQRPKVEVSASYPQNPQTNMDSSPFSSDLRLHVPIQKKPPENSRSPTVLCSGGASVKSATTCFTPVARTSFTVSKFAFYSFFGAVAPAEVARRAAGARATVVALRATTNTSVLPHSTSLSPLYILP